MEPVGFAFGILGPLESLVRDLKNRFENHKEAPGRLDGIATRLLSCHESLSSLNDLLGEGWPQEFPQKSKDICEKDFSRVSELSSSCKKQIEDLQNQVSVDPNLAWSMRSYMNLKRIAKTNRVMAQLDRLDAESKEIEVYVRSLNSLLSKAYQSANLVQVSTVSTERFRAIFKVPRLSGLVVLDFESLETPEGKLKDFLLNQSTTSKQVTAALGAAQCNAPLSGIVGMGGVGKTSALIGLGYDDDVRRRFSDGIHFLIFGQQAKASEVIKGIGRFVRDSGGRNIAEDVESSASVRESAEKAALWFSGRACLFLCDDIWRADGRPQGFLEDLKLLLDTSAESKMVISTRDRTIAEEAGHKVLFEPRSVHGATSLRIFLAYADALEVYAHEAENLSNEILAFCAGLPIALAVAGRLLGRYLQRASNDLQSALRMCLAQLRKDSSEIVEKGVGTYSSFYATIRASLEFLEGDRLRISDTRGRTMFQLFEALCVLKNQGHLPISILQRLWGLSFDETFLIIEKLADMSIIALHLGERDPLCELPDVSISAHDLVLAYSNHLARESNSEGMWHMKLLDGYKCFDLVSERDVQSTGVTFQKSPNPWWDVESDGYIHNNLSRHMTHGGLVAELYGLVSDIRWTKFRVNEGGLLELENDIDMLLLALRNDGVSLGEINALCKDIQILQRSLRLSWATLHKNPRECGFQLFRHLCQLKDSSALINIYLKSIENWTEKPWLRPYHMDDAGSDDLEVMQTFVKGCETVAWTPHEKKIIYTSYEDIIVFNVGRCEEEFRFKGHENIVSSLSCAANGRTMVSGSRDNTVRLWDLETRTQIGETLTGHTDSVTSIAISGDGQTVISASKDKTVRVWKLEGDKLIRKYCRRCFFNVRSVAMSENGQRAVSSRGTVWDTRRRRIKQVGKLRLPSTEKKHMRISQVGVQLVTGSRDGTVRLWNLDEKKMGHVIFKGFRGVMDVSMSADGSRVAACFTDGTARVWDTLTRKIIATPIIGSSRFRVNKCALDSEGSQLALTNYSGKITVLNVSATGEEKDRIRPHTDSVRSIAYCAETKTIMSASSDGTLQTWNADTGLPSGEPLSISRPCRSAYCLAISRTGKKIAVAFRWAGAISVWDLHNRNKIATIEIGRFAIRRDQDIRNLGISGSGKFVFLQENGNDVIHVWDTSKSAPLAIPRNEVPHSLQHDIALMEKQNKERGSIIFGSEQQSDMIKNEFTDCCDFESSYSREWKLRIESCGREVILVDKYQNQAVIGTLSDHIFDNCWIVYRNSRGEQVLVVGDEIGRLHWFTIVM